MEEEIDRIFVKTINITSDDEKIENLEKTIRQMRTLEPYLKIIQGDVGEIKINHQIFQVQLSALASDLEMIQKQGEELRKKMEIDKTLFTKLKDLVVALSIDQEYIQILENGVFDNKDHLARMEQALNILSGFDAEKYTIRLVAEMKTRIEQIEKRFYRRFEVFLNKLLVKTNASGELRVHKELYKLMKQYSFIFQATKKKRNAFIMIYNSYCSFTGKIYAKEFQSHIEAIKSLINDPYKLSLAIEVLLKSFESLIIVENNFLKNFTDEESDILRGTKAIFRETEELALNFINDMFKRQRIVTILSVSNYINSVESETQDVIHDYLECIKEKNSEFQFLFLKDDVPVLIKLTSDEVNEKECMKRINKLNYLFIQEDLYQLQKEVLLALNNRVKSSTKNKNQVTCDNIRVIIEYIQHYSTLKLKDSLANAASVIVQDLKSDLCKKVTQFVFSSDDLNAMIRKIINMVNFTQLEGGNELLRLFREIIIENVDSDEKKDVLLFFNKINIEFSNSPNPTE